MALYLAIDLGNTTAKLGVFKGDTLLRVKNFPEGAWREILAFCRTQKISGAILASVVRHPKTFEKGLSALFPLLVLHHKTPLPLLNKYKTPETLGYDRLSAAVGGWQLFRPKPVLVIEAGTCVKYEIVSRKGEYLGGAIAPGLQMRFDALHHFTQKLPLVKPVPQTPLLGNTTETAIRSGVQQAIVAEVGGMIAAYRKQFPGLQVVIGGGNAAFLAKQLKTRIFVRPNLVLEGLNAILKHNVENRFIET